VGTIGLWVSHSTDPGVPTWLISPDEPVSASTVPLLGHFSNELPTRAHKDTFKSIPTTALAIPSCPLTCVGKNWCLALIRMAVALGYLNNFRMALPVTLPAARRLTRCPTLPFLTAL